MAYKNKDNRKLYLIQRPCCVCEIIQLKENFNKYQHRCITCENKNLRKCANCKEIKTEDLFGNNKGRCNGISSICKKCMNTKRSNSRKIRNIFRDYLKRMKFKKDGNLYDTLGFTKYEFINKFPILPKGYHIDHMIPLSWFIEDTPIKISCSLHNLQLLVDSVNLSKKNIFCDKPSDNQYIIDCIPFIKKEYVAKVKNLL